MLMEIWIGAINLGFLYSFMAIGTFITYKIYNFPDITVDGSFTTGASIAAVLVISGVNPFTALAAAFLGGVIAGLFTGIIHTRFKINGLLAGILVMTGLYSINLRIMGKSNIPLLSSPGFVNIFGQFNPGINSELWLFCCLTALMIFFWFIISVFFKTDFGVTMRAAGSNPLMVSANGVNENMLKIFGIALANGFVGLSGGLVAQYQGFSDIGMGVGSVVASLAAVIIGEAVIKHRSVFLRVFSVIAGSVIFRLMVALALLVGLDPNDLKLITAVFVLLTLVTTGAFSLKKLVLPSRVQKVFRPAYVAGALIFILLGYFLFSQFLVKKEEKHLTKIGVILPNDSEMLTNTLAGFLERMNQLGYKEGENCTILQLNANGDIPTLSSIVDNFINKGVDIYVPISTASTQAVINKIKDKPVVFATVANPFIIGAGKTDTDHPPNVTGIYGTMPMDGLIDLVRKMYPGKLRLGVIWNPSFPNSENNVEKLRSVIAKHKNIELIGATITGTGEVYQAAGSLINRGIDAFFLIPDINVFSAFDSVNKEALRGKVPIFTGDVERLADGALAVNGYEYIISGHQAAEVVDRIIRNESPAGIPFQRYRASTLGLNFDVAKKIGVTFPDEVISKANARFENNQITKKIIAAAQTPSVRKRLAVFQFSENTLLDMTTKGFIESLNKDNFLANHNIELVKYNANADFNTAQSIAADIVSKEFDFIGTISTVALQVIAGKNKNIPHVFAAVTDPIASGVGSDYNNHMPALTGLATPQPVETTIRYMRQLFPQARKIGIIWNSSEKNSEVCTKMARKYSANYNFQLIERTIGNVNDIEEAFKSLMNEEVDIFFTSGDATVSVVVPSLAKRLAEKSIPYFTNTPDDINSGAFFCVGAEYYDVGFKAGEIMKRVINGERTAEIPIEKYVPERYSINISLAKKLNAVVTDELIKNARTVVK
jgi:putative tryptophan/tyrosine transport system permease protein